MSTVKARAFERLVRQGLRLWHNPNGTRVYTAAAVHIQRQGENTCHNRCVPILFLLPQKFRKENPAVGDLRAAAAGADWLAIQKAVQTLLQQSSTDHRLREVKHKSRVPHNASQLVPFKSMKKASMQAMHALGGTGTQKQVQDHLRRNPGLIEGANASNLERCLKRVRVRRYCEQRGRNDSGEIIWGVPAEALPRGVTRVKNGFRASFNGRIMGFSFRGPRRQCSRAAQRDHEKLGQLYKTMTPTAMVAYVQAWFGATVGIVNRHRP